MKRTSTEYRKYIRDRRYHKINLYKVENGCLDCRYNKHPKALCFDHIKREEKTPLLDASKSGSNMSTLVCRISTTNKEKNREYIRDLFTEIRKCVIRCQNCHSIKTWEERDYMPHVRKHKNKLVEEPCYVVNQKEFNV